MASHSFASGCRAVQGQAWHTTCSKESTVDHLGSSSLQSARCSHVASSAPLQRQAICSLTRGNVVRGKAFCSSWGGANCLFLNGNGNLHKRWRFSVGGGSLLGSGHRRPPGCRAAQEGGAEGGPEEKPKRRRAAPRAKKADPPAEASEGAAPTPKRATTRRRTTKAKADAESEADVDPPPRRMRAPRKKAAAAAEEPGPSAPDLKEGEAREGGQISAEDPPPPPKPRRRRKAAASSSSEPEGAPPSSAGPDRKESGQQQKDESKNGVGSYGDGNGAAAPPAVEEEAGSRKLVVGDWVGGANVREGDGRPPRDSVSGEVLAEDEELKVVAQKIIDGRARDLKLRPELDKLLDHFFMQECTKCHKVFVGRRPAPEQPYYGVCRRPSDGNRWRNEAHDVVDTHVPSAITQPYPITHKLGNQTRYRYRVPAIFAICQMAGATFPSTDNEFFDCIRRHDSRYEPFHIGVLDLDEPPPPGGWRKDDAELLATETRKQKLDMLRLRGHEFQDTYMPDDTGMTPKTFPDKSVPMDLQNDWNAISRAKDKYRP